MHMHHAVSAAVLFDGSSFPSMHIASRHPLWVSASIRHHLAQRSVTAADAGAAARC